MEAADWLVACDYAKDQNMVEDTKSLPNKDLVYLKRIDIKVIELLKKNLPYCHSWLRRRNNPVTLFPKKAISCVFEFLNLKPLEKYTGSVE